MKFTPTSLLLIVAYLFIAGVSANEIKAAPLITNMAPNPVPGKSIDQAVGIFGSGFVSGSGLKVRVKWPTGQTDLQGTQVNFVSSTQLTIFINVGTSAASWTAQVINPDAQASNAFSFTVTAANPSISSVSPSSYPASANNQTMTINGSDFQSGATLTFDPPNGSNINSTASKLTFNSSSQITYQFNNANDVGTWTVKVNNPNGQSSNAVGFQVTAQAATLPSAPQNFAAAGGNGQNGLAWNAPSSNGGATITSYRVFRGTTSSNRQIVTSGGCANLGAVLGCTDTGLTNGQSYNYIVSAVNSAGQGPPSNAATATPSAPATLPDAPRNLDASGDDGKNYLGWNAPSSNGGATITSYRVFRGTTSSNRQLVTSGGCANLGAVLACTDTGLTNGQSYNYIVSAVNSAGQGAPSNSVTATPAASTLTISSMNPNPVPGKSIDQAVTIFGSGFVNGSGLKVRVSWPTGQTDLQGSQVSFNSSTQLTILINVGTSAANWTAQVINPNGQMSNAFSFTVTAGAPVLHNVSPSSYPASANNQTMTINGSDFQSGATLTFDPPNGSNINSTASKLTFNSSSQITYQFNNANDVGTWTVKVNNPNGQSSNAVGFQVTAVASSLLPAPTLSAPSNGASGVSVTPNFSWSSVSGANKYWITVATNSGTLPTDPNATSCPGCVISCNVSTNSHTGPSCSPGPGFSATLSSNTTYYWRAQGYNSAANPVQQGQYSSIFSFTTKTSSSQTPLASFTYSPSLPGTGQSVQFNGSAAGATPITWNWDFNADGITDTTAQNPTHVFPSPGTYPVSLTARNAYGTDSYTTDVVVAAPASSGTPVITRVTRQYPNFIRGTYDNRFDVNVDWKGSPGTLSFSIGGGTAIVENGTASGGSHVFHMGSDFTPKYSATIVTITPRNAAGVAGTPWPEHVYVYPYPSWLSDAISHNYGSFSFNATGTVLNASIRSEYPKPHLSPNGPIYVPSYVPFLGGENFGPLETFAAFGMDFSSSGQSSASLSGQTGFTAMGQTLTGRGTGSMNYGVSAPRGLVISGASLNLNIAGKFTQDKVIADVIPALGAAIEQARDLPYIGSLARWFYEVGKLHLEFSPSIDNFVLNWTQDDAGSLRFYNGSGTIRIKAIDKISTEIIHNNVTAAGWLSVEGSITVGVPEPPFLRSMIFDVEAGSEFKLNYIFGIFQRTPKVNARCQWSSLTGTTCRLTSASGNNAIALGHRNDWTLSIIKPDYASFGKYSMFKPTRILKSNNSTLPLSMQESTLITNIFPGATPVLTEVDATRQILLWQQQDANLPVTQSTDISWSFNSGNGWSTPALIAHDSRMEISPVAAADGTGKIIAAWLRVKDPAFSTPVNTVSELPLFYKQHEVVSAVFNPATQTWEPIAQLTDDTNFDTSLSLSSDNAGHLLLTWLSNPTGEFTSTTSSPSALKYSFWNGSSWSAPAVVANSLAGVSTHSAAIQGANAFVIVPRDPGPDTVGDGVLDLYRWNGSGWSAASTFAAGGIDNRLPSAVYDATGKGHVVWLRGENIVHATLSDSTPRVVRANSGSLGFYGAQLLTNPQGNLTLVWQQTIDNGPANLFATLYDPASQIWSADRRLNEDPWMAHNMSGYYGSDGLIHAAYLNTEVKTVSETIVFDGQPEVVSNVLRDGRTDLRLLERSLIVDLAVTDRDLTLTSQSPTPGESVTASLKVHNNGDFPVSNFSVKLYLGDPNAGGVVLGSSTVSAIVPAGDQGVLTFPFSFPSGSGNIIAVVDANNNVTEIDEGNNRATIYLTNTAPRANVTANVTSGGVPSTVTFDASGSVDAEGDALSFAWSFADGSQSASGASVSHTFSQPGIYPVTAIVTDSKGASGMAVVTITIGSSVQFDAVAYSSAESAASALITITRSGDTTGTATVDYRTTDTDTFTIGCADTVNNQGGAYARCDFAVTVGTLSFAAGEINKTITVPLIDDGHDEGAETFQLQLSNAVGSGTTLGAHSTATVTILDNDEAGARNPIITLSPADYPFFVRQQYLDFLSREPEPSEPWTAVLNRCSNVHTPPTVNTDCDRIAVSGAFFGSPEFRIKGFYVFRFYKVAFNRLPDYREIVADMSFVAGATAAEVYARRAQLATSFAVRQEFTNTYSSKTNAQYVAALLGRYQLSTVTTPDPAAPDGATKVTLSSADLVNSLNVGTLTRAQVLRAIADSDQVFAIEYNSAFVAVQYYGYLRRTPDDNGYQAWLRVINQDPNNIRIMVNGFMNSTEYRLRFGTP